MYKFYFLLWVRWAVRLSLCSVALAMVLSVFITTVIYFLKSNASLDADTLKALFDIWKFWAVISWNLTLLIALFRSLKYIFNSCINGYNFQLLECNKQDVIEVVGYGDLVKVFRRWFFSIIWLIASFVVIGVGVAKLFGTLESSISWFNVYWLYGFLMLSGFISFGILGSITKRVKVSRC